MIVNEKNSFATRMNKVADILGIPPKGENRQALLGKMFKVSQEAARKWLAGESMPQMAKSIEISKKAKVSIEWFLTGRGIAQYDQTPESQVLMAMQEMDESTKYQVVKITNSLTEPKANGTHE
jgi:transcriptional regulator with XRE-family HTH domain